MKSFLTQLRHARASPGCPKVDIVSRLPFELHIIILSYFEPVDVDAALSASRRWRGIWLSEEIWPKLAEQWYPGLEDHIRAGSQEMGDAFRRTLHKIQRRMSGKFATALHYEMRLQPDWFFTLSKGVPVLEGGVHSYDDVDGLELSSDTRFPRFMMYNNGRIAWWPEAYVFPYFAIVDDLRTRKRRAYLFPNHQGDTQGFKTSMSDKLILMGRRRTLHAWHLEQDQLYSTEIPEEIARCVAEGDTVLIVSKNAEIFLWKLGCRPRHIRIDGCYERGLLGTSQLYDFISGQFVSRNPGTRLVQSGILLDFIISPTEDDVLFVITFTPAPLDRLEVNEIRDGQLAGTYRLDRSEWTKLIMVPDDFTITTLRWEKVDSYGGYCLTQAAFQHAQTGSDPNAAYCESSDVDGLLSVCFNIHNKSFTVSHYHHKECHDQQNAFQIWNNRIAASDNAQGPVLSLYPCSTKPPDDEGRITPLYTTVQCRRTGLSRRQLVPFEKFGSRLELSAADFALDAYQQFNTNPVEHNSTGSFMQLGIRRLVGDDDFLLLIDKKSYTVWSFGNEMPEKAADSDRSLWRSLIH
ncbi:hypothetical protein F4677DRAFT_435963 [Hypoxylon crocopeplum]|nr:hypothetical protein F4677DRAFT_435963 [Hypoxylon crocopeplum]